MGRFHLWGLVKPRIWTSVITCKLNPADTFHFNKEWLARAPPSSTEKGQLVCLQSSLRAADGPCISMFNAQQFCGWDIAYRRLGPPGSIRIVGYLQEPCRQRIGIFASNTHGVTGDHPQELLQKHRDAITPEYPHKPCVTNACTACPTTYRGPILNRQRCAARLNRVTV